MGYQIFVFTSFLVSFIVQHGNCHRAHVDESFVQRKGTHFVLNGKPYYVNGFNAYWLMIMASDPSTKSNVTSAFEQASKHGLNLGRSFAFNEGDFRPLQTSPGSYNENVFKGLDFVISEARKFGVKLILGFVNNWKALGGRSKYVQWAREKGEKVINEDDFFTHPVVKQYYKNHIKTVLTRKNTINGLLYKDDPTIFSWELINEPRINETGKSIQNWVSEMASYVKSIDSNHLLEIGLEGLYGESKQKLNPYSLLIGTDFISNNRIPEIDFSTIHVYHEYWLQSPNQSAAIEKWIEGHIEDSNKILQKPIIVAEFGKSSKSPGYSIKARDDYYKEIYSIIYASATRGGSCAGAMFWQLLTQGMDSYGDGFEVILENSPSIGEIIKQQSTKMSNIKL